MTSSDGKRLYVLQGGRLLTINLDDCLLIKDNIDDEGEEYISIPKPNDLNEMRDLMNLTKVNIMVYKTMKMF